MISISPKKAKRLEKKKQKKAALLFITQLNEEISNKDDNITESSKKCDDGTIAVGPSGKPKLSGEDFMKLKQQLRLKDKLRQRPQLTLLEVGEAASLTVKAKDRIPLHLCDIQNLIMYSQLGHHSSYNPSYWCNLNKYNKLKNTNVLIVENVSMCHYQSNKNLFEFLNEKFPIKLELITSGTYEGDLVRDLATIPLTGVKMRQFINEYGSLKAAVNKSPDLYNRATDLAKEECDEIIDASLPEGDKFPRTQLLLSGWQMVDENYPLPIAGLDNTKYSEYVVSKDKYEDVNSFSPMFGLDCEMCETTNKLSELTRISIVDENYQVIYETLVKPDNRITNYLTRFSGITPKMMQKVTKNLKEVQEDLKRLLPPDAILVGQSLNNDLHALKMMHPYIIDTSFIYNVTGYRNRKCSLKYLAMEFLNLRIQDSIAGHCSIEDSVAALKLTKLKLSKHLYFGDAVKENVESQVNHYPELGNASYATSMLKQLTKYPEKSAHVISNKDIFNKYFYYTFKDEPKSEEHKIEFSTSSKNGKLIKKMCTNIGDSSLNIAHLVINDSELKSDMLQVCQDIDKWIKDIYTAAKNTNKPSLSLVILGGQSESGNGCCFIVLEDVQQEC